MKTKVLYVITKADVGGAQKYVADLINNLDRNRFETKIICGGKDLHWLSNKTRPWFFFINDWLAILELVKTFRREEPNVIHLNSSKAGVLGSLAAGIFKLTCRLSHSACPKVIFTAHGWVFNPTNYLSAPVRWFYILLHKCAALFQDKIINVSEYDRRLARRYEIAPEGKLVTIYNGIDLNIPFLPREEARKEILTRLEIRDSRLEIAAYPWVGSIGRLTKEKNYETLIAAARLIPEACFFIIGGGAEYTKLQLLVTRYSLLNTFLVPPTGNDARFLKAFDVFALPSIKEGLPYTLLETMCASLPVVVSDVGGMPEIVSHEKNGVVVPVRNIPSLAGAIHLLIHNERYAAQLGAAAGNTVRNYFTFPRMLARTERLYSALAPETNL